MPSCKGFAYASGIALLACKLGGATAMAAELRDLAPVRLYPVQTETTVRPAPLPPLPPVVDEGVEAGDGLRASLFAPATGMLDAQGVDWLYSRRLKSNLDYGIAGGARAAPLRASSLTSADSWELGAENWRFTGNDGTDLTLGSYSPRTLVWGGGARLGGIAVSRSLTDSAVPQDQLQYGLALGAINYTDADATSGALTYGAGASDAVVRYGVSPDLTLETQVQWAPDMVTAGVGGMYSTTWGAWRLGVAKATRNLHDGWRYRVGYDVGLIDDVRLSWLTEQRSGGFSDLSNYTGFAGDSGQTRNLVSTSIGLGRWGKLRGSYEHVASVAEPVKQQFIVSQQFWYSPNLRVSLSAQRERLTGDFGLGFELSLPIQ